MLRVAVVGLGPIGRTHVRCYAKNPDAELVAVCDLDPGRADPLAREYSVPAYHDLDRMLAAERLDAVSVATAGEESGGDHYGPTMRLLDAGKHVLVEKPISNDLGRAREMVRRAEERGVMLGVDLNHRFNPAAARAKKLQDDGLVGEVLFVNLALCIDNRRESAPWLQLRALHQHSVDVMRYFGGPIAKVQAFCHRAPGRTIWSTASVNVHFASGAVGHLTGSYDASWHHPIERCEVAGSKGRFVIENIYERLEFFPRDSADRIAVGNPIIGGVGGFNETFDQRIDAFVAQVAAGGPLDASGADGLAAQEVIEGAIRSFENGTVEEVDG